MQFFHRDGQEMVIAGGSVIKTINSSHARVEMKDKTHTDKDTMFFCIAWRLDTALNQYNQVLERILYFI